MRISSRYPARIVHLEDLNTHSHIGGLVVTENDACSLTGTFSLIAYHVPKDHYDRKAKHLSWGLLGLKNALYC